MRAVHFSSFALSTRRCWKKSLFQTSTSRRHGIVCLAEVVRQCSPLKAECWEQSYRSSRGSEPGGGCWGRALHSVRVTFVDAVSGGRAWGLGTRSLATSAGGHGREMISIFGLLLRERHQEITPNRGANSSGEQNNRKPRECLCLAPSVRTFSAGNRLLQPTCPVLALLQRHVPHHRAMEMRWRQTTSRLRRAAGGWEGFLSLPRRSLPVSSRAGRH